MSGIIQQADTASRTIAAGQAAPQAIGYGYYPEEGSRAISAQYNWAAQSAFAEDLSQVSAKGIETTIQSVYIDNGSNAQSVTITVPGTDQVVTCAANYQGIFALFMTGMTGFIISTAAPIAATTRCAFLNVPIPPATWPVSPVTGGGALAGASSLFGTGADGTVVISAGTTTLTRDMNYANLTINGTGQLNTAGFRVFVSGILDLSACPANGITSNTATGNAGVGAVGGNCVGGNIAPLTGTQGSGSGGTGGTGVGPAGGSNAAAQVNASNGGQTGAGGSGGASGTPNAGGAGAVQGKPNFNPGNAMIVFPTPWTGPFWYAIPNNGSTLMAALWPSYTAGGGGAGGGDGVNAGGGGGASATPTYGIAIFAAIIQRGSNATAAIIQAKGQTGGAGGNGVGGSAGGGGGGGGTGGAFVYIVAGQLLGSAIVNAIDVSGGTGGAGGNGLTTGSGGRGGDGGGAGGVQTIVLSPASFTQSAGWNTAGTAGSANAGTAGGAGGPGAIRQVNL